MLIYEHDVSLISIVAQLW